MLKLSLKASLLLKSTQSHSNLFNSQIQDPCFYSKQSHESTICKYHDFRCSETAFYPVVPKDQNHHDPLCHPLQQARQAEASEVVSSGKIFSPKIRKFSTRPNSHDMSVQKSARLMLTCLRYEAKEAKEKKKICRELTSAILLRYIEA